MLNKRIAAPNVTPETFERRKIAQQGYGWRHAGAWWDYVAPSFTKCGPDPEGWASFVVARIYRISYCGIGHAEEDAGKDRFLAVPFGCRWKSSDGLWVRKWYPTFRESETLEAAMDFCEEDLATYGVIPALQTETT